MSLDLGKVVRRVVIDTTSVLDGIPKAPVCTCGHAHEAHEHNRAGSDCSLCDCVRYEAAR